jgi:hypothetical protein
VRVVVVVVLPLRRRPARRGIVAVVVVDAGAGSGVDPDEDGEGGKAGAGAEVGEDADARGGAGAMARNFLRCSSPGWACSTSGSGTVKRAGAEPVATRERLRLGTRALDTLLASPPLLIGCGT